MVKGTDLHIAKIDGVYPSPENVREGRYNLKTPFAIVWKGQLSGGAKRFVEYLFSRDAQKIIFDNGAVPAGL
jgi:phosphate transport system substrate-binding protein